MKRIARIGGVIAGLGAGVVAALWLLKDKIAGPPPAPVASSDVPRFRVAPAPPVPEPAGAPAPDEPADELTDIRGIGPVYAARLAEIGITSFAGLAAAAAEDVAERIDAAPSQVEDWIGQARDRSGR